jgi:hypothetical protein
MNCPNCLHQHTSGNARRGFPKAVPLVNDGKVQCGTGDHFKMHCTQCKGVFYHPCDELLPPTPTARPFISIHRSGASASGAATFQPASAAA